MVSPTGVAAVVALVLLGTVINVRLLRSGEQIASERSEAPATSTGSRVGGSGEQEWLVRDGEELQFATGPSTRGAVLAGVARGLLVGLPFGLVTGLFCWLVAGVVPGGAALADVAFVVGIAAPPTVFLWREAAPPLFGRTRHALTNQRLVAYSSRSRKELRSIPLQAVRDIAVESRRLEGTFGIGSVTVTGGAEAVTIDRVGDPDAVAAAIRGSVANASDE